MTAHDPQRADRILAAIEDGIVENGYPPTLRELAATVGLATASGVLKHVRSLEESGDLVVLRDGAGRYRGLDVIRRPRGAW